MAERSSSRMEKFIVGVTGNIATGKSVIMRLAAEEGALTIDADRVVHEIMDSDADMQAAIAVAYGPEVRRPDGRIDRRKLGDIVFKDPEALRDLEEMIHPAVHDEVRLRIEQSESSIVFIEAIKLLEGALGEGCNQIWVTRCSPKRQLERLRICRGLESKAAAARIKSQAPQEEKVARADVVIETDGYLKDTTLQFDRAWARLPESAKQGAKAEVPSAFPTASEKSVAAPKKAVIAKPSRQLGMPKSKAEAIAAARKKREAVVEAGPAPDVARLKDLEVRRARPSDIPSVLLHIQKATGGAVQLKRADLLMALSERSYFIGQVGADVSTVMGWNIDNQVARVDQIYVHPLEAVHTTGSAIIREIEASAEAHICELIIVFLPENTEGAVHQLFADAGYTAVERNALPAAWQAAIDESQPDDTYFLVKILRDERLEKSKTV